MELQGWTSDFLLPVSVWLPGFFNPQSLLTAIMQSTARKNELPLDKMCLVCEVTKKVSREDFSAPPKEGAYIHGMFMEVVRPSYYKKGMEPITVIQGARWDLVTGVIAESKLKELHPCMPVMYVKAIMQETSVRHVVHPQGMSMRLFL